MDKLKALYPTFPSVETSPRHEEHGRRAAMPPGLLRYNGGGDPGYPGKVMEWAEEFGE